MLYCLISLQSKLQHFCKANFLAKTMNNQNFLFLSVVVPDLGSAPPQGGHHRSQGSPQALSTLRLSYFDMLNKIRITDLLYSFYRHLYITPLKKFYFGPHTKLTKLKQSKLFLLTFNSWCVYLVTILHNLHCTVTVYFYIY